MIELKQYDTARPIQQNLVLNGAPVPMDEVSVVYLNFYDTQRGTSWQRTAEIVDRATADVRYYPVAGDVDESGLFELEWEIVYNDARRLTVPTNTRVQLMIYPAIPV